MKILPAMLVAVSLGAGANSAPPSAPFDAIGWKPTATTKPSLGIKMGTFEVKWEETTLASVLAAAGRGAIQHQGDAGESVYWLCYTVEGAHGHRLWVMAHGEMGGPEHAVTSITAEALKDAKGEKDCPILPVQLQPVVLSQGLWVGASEVNAQKILGQPSHTEGPWSSFDHWSKMPGTCDGGFDLTNWLLYKVNKGRLVTVMAGQVTSC